MAALSIGVHVNWNAVRRDADERSPLVASKRMEVIMVPLGMASLPAFGKTLVVRLRCQAGILGW